MRLFVCPKSKRFPHRSEVPLTREDREVFYTQCSRASVYLERYVRYCSDLDAPKTSTEHLIRIGKEMGATQAFDPGAPSDKASWTWDVAIALRDANPCRDKVSRKLDEGVILGRLAFHRPWNVVSDALDIPVSQVKSTLQRIIPAFVAILDRKELPEDYRVREEYAA